MRTLAFLLTLGLSSIVMLAQEPPPQALVSLSKEQSKLLEKQDRKRYKLCGENRSESASACVEVFPGLETQLHDHTMAMAVLDRGCRLGFAAGCVRYGEQLGAANDLSGARASWLRCQGEPACRTDLFWSYAALKPVDLHNAETYGRSLCEESEDDNVCKKLVEIGSEMDYPAVLVTRHNKHVEKLTAAIQEAETDAANKDQLAAQADELKNQSTNTSGLLGALGAGLGAGLASGYRNTANADRNRAAQMRSELASLGAVQPPTGQASNPDWVVQRASTSNSIEDAKNQALAKIQSIPLRNNNAGTQAAPTGTAPLTVSQSTSKQTQTIVPQPQKEVSNIPTPSSTSPGRCPNGSFRGGTYDGHPCDCRSNSAAYNCPSTDSAVSTATSVKPRIQDGGESGVSRSGSQLQSRAIPPSGVAADPAGAARTPGAPIILPPTPSFSSQDSHGNVTLGTGTPSACATSPSGSQLPLTPGTTAGTCNPASCRGTGYSVHLESRWTDATKTEVIGFFDNNSLGDVTCTWAFHKHGVWTDEGQMYLKFHDQHKGGEFGGVWSKETDSSDIKYACFEGIDPVDVHGKLCNQGIAFVGATTAGTDK